MSDTPRTDAALAAVEGQEWPIAFTQAANMSRGLEREGSALRKAVLVAHGMMRRQFDKGEAPDWWGDDEHEAYSVLTAALASTHRTEGHFTWTD